MTSRYRIEKKPLGEGGMATVYRAIVTSAEGFRRPVAIKYIHERLASQPKFEADFRAEARLISLLNHPNIVQVLDFDRDEDGRLFLVMELVVGTDLRGVRNRGALPPHLAASVAAEVLKGLAYAHAAVDENDRQLRIVHRDLSPANILVSWDGLVKISDFGIAQGVGGATTATGVIKGNLGYMSPEQVEGGAVDARTDIYAVGVLLHELLLGRPLFAKPGTPTRSILTQVLLGRIESPTSARSEVPTKLSNFVLRLLSQDRNQRPDSAQRALEELLGLGLVFPTAGLDLAQHLKGHRRDTETPTVLDDQPAVEAPAVVVPSSASDTLILDSQPIPGTRSTPRREPVVMLVTVGLGVLVLILGGLLLRPLEKPEGGQNVIIAHDGAPSPSKRAAKADVRTSAPVSVDSGSNQRVPSRRASRSARRRGSKTAIKSGRGKGGAHRLDAGLRDGRDSHGAGPDASAVESKGENELVPFFDELIRLEEGSQ